MSELAPVSSDAPVTQSVERDRSKIPDTYKWDLTAVYASDEAWAAAKAAFESNLPTLGRFKGSLHQSAARLADALETMSTFDKELSRLHVYASMRSDEDTRISKGQAMRQEMVQLASKFDAEAAYIEPEILKLDGSALERFVAGEPRLKPYLMLLSDISRRRAHTLSDAEERLLASAGVMASTAGTIRGIFADADFPYPTVTLSSGQAVKVDQAAFSQYRALPVRSDRQAAMSAFFGALGSYSRTFGAAMAAKVTKDLFYARERRYPSCLAAALDGGNIPVDVYTRLIAGTRRHLPTFHRYLGLRKRMLGVSELHYYDLYAPLVSSVELKYTVEEAHRDVLASIAPLGADYRAVTERAFTERWIDYFPNHGKRSGAYSDGDAHDVHPFMLLNYNGRYDDVSTLAHECGHALHSYYSSRTQPYPLAHYSIFVAEVASTFNEALLIHHTLGSISDDGIRLSLLGNYLEGIKGTIFRQTQFAEFELRFHEIAEGGEAITGDRLAQLYFDVTTQYYGHDAGVCIVDDYVAHEWSFIPHFFRDFYVFQYATSFTASSALAEKVLAGDAEATKRYLTFLGSGGSKYPIELLRDAGVDMTTDEPFELTMKAMNRVMDEIEQLLRKRGI